MVIAEADVHGELGVHALDGRVENGRQFLAVLVDLAESRFIDLNEIRTSRYQRLKLFVDDSDKVPGEFLLIPVACGDSCPRGKGRRTGACHLRGFRGVLPQVCELLYDPQPSGRADLAHDLVDLARMSPLVDDPDDQEQHAGGDAVVDLLDDAAGDSVGVQREDP